MPRPKIFISYSHKDEREVAELVGHLSVLQNAAGLVEVWNDQRIGAGADWKKEIEQAMSEATVAILLISRNFLNSDFILNNEVPKLLKRREAEGLTVFPVLAKPCLWEEVPWLAAMNVRPKDNKAVWRAGGRYADDELTRITREVIQIVRATERKQAAAQSRLADEQELTARAKAAAELAMSVQAERKEQQRLAAARAEQEQLARERAELTLTLAPNVTLELVRVPAGEFLMGSDKTKDTSAWVDELPQHTVYLDAYLIGKYPVTVAQFAAFVKASGYKFELKQDAVKKANHPVTHVNWNDARAFCEWASQITKRKIILPSEAQWEKAARGGDGRVYPWGNDSPTDKHLNFKMNVKDTTPVGAYSPRGDSPYGCADMAGNVWEWTSSLLMSYPFRADDGREDLNAQGVRALRGGSWNYDQDLARCADRYRNHALNRDADIGFRVAGSLS